MTRPEKSLVDVWRTRVSLLSRSAMDVDEDISEAAQLGQRIVDAILERQPRTAVDALLAADAPLWFQASDGTSALHAAAYSQDADLVRNLLEKGAVWNSGELIGFTRRE
jgi:protein arginine N-methyltransferase 2